MHGGKSCLEFVYGLDYAFMGLQQSPVRLGQDCEPLCFYAKHQEDTRCLKQSGQSHKWHEFTLFSLKSIFSIALGMLKADSP